MANRSFERLLAVACAVLAAAGATSQPSQPSQQGTSAPRPVPEQQSDRARTEALARRAGDRLIALQRDADRLAAEERTVINDLRRLEVERQMKIEALKRAEAEVVNVQTDLAETESQMAALQATERAARPELSSRLVELYKLGQARYARVLLSAPDLRRVGQAARTVAVLAQLDRDRIARYQQTLEALASTRQALQERERQATASRTAAERAQAAALRAAQAKSDLVRDIDRRRDLNAQVSAELQAAQQKLQMALREAANISGGDIATALPLRPFKGALGWPVTGQLRHRFGGVSGSPGSSSNGIEITTDDGSTVVAVHDGLVAFAGSFSGFGNLVILDHGSQAFSLYGDLLDLAVAKGARIERGQTVGSAGPLPSGGTGVYFELRIDGRPVDPLQWLERKHE